VPVPSSNTSDADKQTLIVISAFNRFLSNCVDSIELRHLGPALFTAPLAQWLLSAYETHPDKQFKKVTANTLKSLVIQLSGLKYGSATPPQSLGQLLGLSLSALHKQLEGQRIAAPDLT
jgi:hypothetical protein